VSPRLRYAVSLMGLAFVLGIAGCGGGTTPPPPSDCVSTATIKCTQSGAVQGVAIGSLYAFRGIPYAAPPVGNLRWKAPQPPANWNGIRDTSQFGNICPQFNFGGQLVGNEDCLTLNVYVSQNPPNQKQPVMVSLHGGSNSQGDAQLAPAGMPLLALQGVVVVTAQYRLGMPGLFCQPAVDCGKRGSSGHYGLADQVAALEWVHNNIAAFGGDPHHVMLFGQSAGGWDVETLLAAPSAQRLFSVAGIESGPVPVGRLPQLSSLEATDQSFVAAAGCSSAVDVLACMRALPADTIVNLQGPYHFYSAVGSPFLPTDPFAALQQNGSPVPLLIGSNREEFALFESPNSGIDDNAYTAAVHQRFDPFGAGIANQVLALYPTSAYTNPAYALIGVDTDFNFSCETRDIARAAAGSNRKPVWRYLYTHAMENDASLQRLRAFHAQEAFFVFDNFSGLGGGYTPMPAEVVLATDMMGYWTRFAATGDPNESEAVAWPHYDPSTDSMLQIDDAQVAINGYNNPQCDYLSTLPQP
jgi:para-nitrobenzyl esterase